MSTAVAVGNPDLSPEQIQKIAAMRVFFGHKSVGDDILHGLNDLMTTDSRLRINIVRSDSPVPLAAGLQEFYIGQNGDPKSKNAAFSSAMERLAGAQGGVAMYKYCYVDVKASTDASAMFHEYQRSVDSLKAKHPNLTIVHVTLPLTTVEPAWKAQVKSLLGRTSERDINFKRNEFNDLLRSTYQGRAPIFDLAEAESTRPDGTRTSFRYKGRTVYSMTPEFTTDGGHLNELGRRAAARKLLQALASL